MRLLDLFCGAGGAAVGYHRAGFDEIVGVDNRPQKNYPFEFIQADAMTYPLDGFDAIHASPPCQKWTQAQRIQGREHPDLLTPTRIRLAEHGTPFVLENVPGAPIRHDVLLCGSMFGLRWNHCILYRHRWFEAGGGFVLSPMRPASCRHDAPAISVFGGKVLGASSTAGETYKHPNDREKLSTAAGRIAMGINWLVNRTELSEAIPPAYSHFIGKQLLLFLQHADGHRQGDSSPERISDTFSSPDRKTNYRQRMGGSAGSEFSGYWHPATSAETGENSRPWEQRQDAAD